MSDITPGQGPVEAAQALTGALDGMRDELGRLNAYGRRNRRLIWITAGSIVLDVILTILLVFVYGTARQSQAQAREARVVSVAQHANLIAACRLSNQSRAASIQLWDHVLSISRPAPGLTAAQKTAQARKVAAFRAYVHRIYAPRNCIALYRIP